MTYLIHITQFSLGKSKIEKRYKNITNLFQNTFKRVSWTFTNSFATSINDILSRIAWLLFSNDRELNLF